MMTQLRSPEILPEQASSSSPISEEEEARVAQIWRENKGIAPSYIGLTEADAILVHRYVTGYGTADAAASVGRARANHGIASDEKSL